MFDVTVLNEWIFAPVMYFLSLNLSETGIQAYILQPVRL